MRDKAEAVNPLLPTAGSASYQLPSLRTVSPGQAGLVGSIPTVLNFYGVSPPVVIIIGHGWWLSLRLTFQVSLQFRLYKARLVGSSHIAHFFGVSPPDVIYGLAASATGT